MVKMDKRKLAESFINAILERESRDLYHKKEAQYIIDNGGQYFKIGAEMHAQLLAACAVSRLSLSDEIERRLDISLKTNPPKK